MSFKPRKDADYRKKFIFLSCITFPSSFIFIICLFIVILLNTYPVNHQFQYTDQEKTNIVILTDAGKTNIAFMQRKTATLVSIPQVTSMPSLTKEPQMVMGSNTPAYETVFPEVLITFTPDTRLEPKKWREWPVLPSVSNTAIEVYRKGVLKGNDPKSFSVIGDCLSYPYIFMGLYDDPDYRLYRNRTDLQETIDQFQGSFSRQSLTVENGMSVAAALSPLWSDSNFCSNDETPIDCELRIHRPTVVFINLGTNWSYGLGENSYEDYLQNIIEKIIDFGAVPILSTKADNIEGDNSINRITAQVAYDYDMPLWNFWSVSQDLLDGGLDAEKDFVYLTPEGIERHSFTALEALDVVWKGVR